MTGSLELERPRIVLCMIVRNEFKVLDRALISVLPFIDAYAIVDTGSHDGTQGLIRARLGHLPGRLIEEPWTDFATARNTALELAKTQGDYALILDADDVLIATTSRPSRMVDVYWLDVVYGGTLYRRPQLVSTVIGARWRGVVHEYLEIPQPGIVHSDIDWRIQVQGGGARSGNPLKYLLDADAINNALKTETDQGLRNRYCFYFAQSYRDAGHSGAAIFWYKVVYGSQGWSEERYIAALNLGRLTDDRDWFVHAAGINPERAEAWRAMGYDRMADLCKIDPSWLFVEPAAYKAEP